jgi:type II secretory pathway pseudopilin PulG
MRQTSVGRRRRQEEGYVLLTMLLVVALLAITAAIALPEISFTIRRDREQEMIHRGVQYSRAIRAYYKKFGRYPTRLEDLDNTNNLRFLRKHYKDPVTGQDFKLLHYGEPGVTLAGGIAGGSIPGANPIGSPGGLNSSSGFAQPSAFGGNSNGGFGGNGNSAFGGNGNSAFGANSNSPTGANSSAATAATGTDPSQTSSPTNSQDPNVTKSGSGSSSDQSSSSQLVASGPIVGVASTSKKSTIREFNKKKKYNEWQFVYDPTSDRGGLITTPNQPNLQGFGSQPGQGLQPGQGMPGNSGSSPFGQPSGFGNPSSPFGNSPNSNVPPVQPPSNPPQQQ